MGIFDDMLASDAAGFTDGWGEAVTLTFQDATTRSVYAIVDRDPPAEFGNGNVPSMVLTFRNDSTYGLAASEVDGGGVITVTVAYPLGATATAHQIHRVKTDMPSDAGHVIVAAGRQK